MAINKFNFKIGEKVILTNSQIGEIKHIYIQEDFKETNSYYIDVDVNNGDTWTFVFNDNIKEEQLKQSDIYKIVHKIGDRVFGDLIENGKTKL